MIARMVLLMLLALPGGAAGADSPADEKSDARVDVLRERLERDAQQEAAWRERHRKRLAEVEQARADLEEKKRAHYALRRRKWRSGKSREAYSREVEEAGTALKAAEQKLDAFYRSARRAGVPPGWVRPPDPSQRPPAAAKR